MKFSIVIPTLNEQETIFTNKKYLQALKAKLEAEIIIVDGGSNDKTKEIGKSITDKIYDSNPSRSVQFNKGAMQAEGEYYIFLHIDTLLNDDAIKSILNITDNFQWGFFHIKLDQKEFKYSFLSFCINLRSKLFNYCTGDQVLIVKKNIFYALNGYKEIDLMEDIDISNRLKRISHPVVLDGQAVTSSRRWIKYGFLRTIFLMRFIRLLFYLGVSTKKLRDIYR